MIEGVGAVATVYVAVLEGALRRRVSVTFSTEVLTSDTASGESFVVDTLITIRKVCGLRLVTNNELYKCCVVQVHPTVLYKLHVVW